VLAIATVPGPTVVIVSRWPGMAWKNVAAHVWLALTVTVAVEDAPAQSPDQPPK
jgi:hypothetical protein